MIRTLKWLLPITVGALLVIVSVNTAHAGCSNKCPRLCALNFVLCKAQAKKAKQSGIITCATGDTGASCRRCLVDPLKSFNLAVEDCKRQKVDCLKLCAS